MAIAERGVAPASITAGNGSEFAGRVLEAWAMENQVQLCFIRPGRPTENGFIESFSARLRDECLNVNWFTSLENARAKLALWREQYNRHRPHSALADRSPMEFAAMHDRLSGGRFALSIMGKATGKPWQGFAKPAVAALDRACRLPLTELRRGRSASANRPGNQRDLIESLECMAGP